MNHDRWFFVQLYRVYQERSDNPSSRDAGALASSGLSPLLAVEVELAVRAAEAAALTEPIHSFGSGLGRFVFGVVTI